MEARTRTYPAACQSYFCGRTSCPVDCVHLPELESFQAWVNRTGAKVVDPVHSPTVFTVSLINTAPSLRRFMLRILQEDPALYSYAGEINATRLGEEALWELYQTTDEPVDDEELWEGWDVAAEIATEWTTCDCCGGAILATADDCDHCHAPNDRGAL